MSDRPHQQKTTRKLGRLSSLGIREVMHAALFLPEQYEDLTELVRSARQICDEPRPIRLRLAEGYRTYYDRVPRMVLDVADSTGERFRATIFGDTKVWMEMLKDRTEGVFTVTGSEYAGRWDLRVRELIEDEWVGTVRPRYAGAKQLITPETTRKLIGGLLDEAIPLAARYISSQMAPDVPISEVLRQVGAAKWTIEMLLQQAHRPFSLRHAEHAKKVLKRLAAIAVLRQLHSDSIDETEASRPVSLRTIQHRIAQLPFSNLTEDQARAINAIADGMSDRFPLRALCTGEVGTGKTCVAGVIAAATVDAVPGGGRVVILCPNGLIATQFFEEIRSYFPDITMQLVTGETPPDTTLDASILIGTSAILHRAIGRSPDLVVVDEQHRWSRDQREATLAIGTHLLELSATPIPRSLALVRYGRMKVIQMKQTHARKEIITKVCTESAKRPMFGAIHKHIGRGGLVLVVHPKREASSKEEVDTDLLGKQAGNQRKAPGGISDRHSVSEALPRWNALYPGLVTSLTGDDDQGTKDRIISDLKEGRGKICLCTTVVEVGITIPELYMIVIVCPERLGLMQLHQLRGRLARKGGKGLCILYSPDPINEKQRKRLEYFASTNDGFALAEFDMYERGIGDLSARSSKQSGSDDTFLFGIKMDAAMLDEVAPLVAKWTAAGGMTAAANH